MKVEKRIPEVEHEVVVTLTRREARAIREALYLAYLSRDTMLLGRSPVVPIEEIVATGNALYKELTCAY